MSYAATQSAMAIESCETRDTHRVKAQIQVIQVGTGLVVEFYR